MERCDVLRCIALRYAAAWHGAAQCDGDTRQEEKHAASRPAVRWDTPCHHRSSLLNCRPFFSFTPSSELCQYLVPCSTAGQGEAGGKPANLANVCTDPSARLWAGGPMYGGVFTQAEVDISAYMGQGGIASHIDPYTPTLLPPRIFGLPIYTSPFLHFGVDFGSKNAGLIARALNKIITKWNPGVLARRCTLDTLEPHRSGALFSVFVRYQPRPFVHTSPSRSLEHHVSVNLYFCGARETGQNNWQQFLRNTFPVVSRGPKPLPVEYPVVPRGTAVSRVPWCPVVVSRGVLCRPVVGPRTFGWMVGEDPVSCTDSAG
eukprot:gene23062-biopygen22279